MRRLVLSLAVIFVVLAVAHVAVDITLTAQIRRAIHTLHEKGVPANPEAFISPHVPDSENAAPLYAKVFELMTADKGGIKFSNPTDIQYNPNVKFILDADIMDFNRWTKEQKEKIPKLLQTSRIQKIYSILETASRKPGFDPHLETKDLNTDEIFTYERLNFKIVKLLLLKAKLEAFSGNTHKSVGTLLTAFRITHQQRSYSAFIMRIYNVEMSLDVLNEILNVSKMQARELLLLEDELSKFSDISPSIKANKMYTAFYIKNLEKSLHEDFKMSGSYYGFNVYIEAFFPDVYKRFLVKLTDKINILLYLEATSKIIDKFDHPFYKISKELEKLHDSKFPKAFSGGFWMSRDVIKDGKRDFVYLARHKARVETFRVFLALKLYKANYGTYPQTLHELAPKILKEIPADPFTGKDFVYKKTDKGFLLYSLGPNGKDDNGKPLEYPFYDDDGNPLVGDIVWKSEI